MSSNIKSRDHGDVTFEEGYTEGIKKGYTLHHTMRKRGEFVSYYTQRLHDGGVKLSTLLYHGGVGAYIVFECYERHILHNHKNVVPLRAKDIFEEVRIPIKSVYNATAYLIKTDVIRKLKPGLYWVNPHYAYRGTQRQLKEARLDWVRGMSPIDRVEKEKG